jgi:transcriptional regulator GlxA family with amidase domain
VYLDEMAQQAAASLRTLSRRFREQTGRFRCYAAERRVCDAQSLLETTDLNIEQVATETGFRRVSPFGSQLARPAAAHPRVPGVI